MTDYSQAYSDSFLIGAGATMTQAVWFALDPGLAPLIAATVTLLVMMFVLPWFLVTLNDACGLPPSTGPQQ